MRHLSPAEFVDAADRTLPAARASHLASCERCGEQAARMRSTLDAAAGIDVPEPSPLYWQHLRANVEARIAHETMRPWWRVRSWSGLLGAKTLVPLASALALTAAVFVTVDRPRPLEVPARPVAAVALPAPIEFGGDSENSEAWEMLTAVAADMPFEAAHDAGLHVGTAAIDRAVQRMSPAELNELGRLLQSQLRGAGD
ncbi:MAG TPA: hypothetical protein VGI12_00305 [Vicinamibacterales bacterium]|jgi:hypothetical protein